MIKNSRFFAVFCRLFAFISLKICIFNPPRLKFLAFSLGGELGVGARKGDFLISYVRKGIRPPRKREGFPEDVKST